MKLARIFVHCLFVALSGITVHAQTTPEERPVVYSLQGVLEAEDSILSVFTESQELCRFDLDPETNYLSIYNQEGIYFAYARRGDSTQFIYLGPKTISSNASSTKAPLLKSPVAEGAKWLGKGALISAGTGFLVGSGIYLANPDEPFAGIVAVFVGGSVTLVGLAVSWWSGVAKGVQVALKNQNQKRETMRQSAYTNNSVTFVAQWVTNTDVPEDIRKAAWH